MSLEDDIKKAFGIKKPTGEKDSVNLSKSPLMATEELNTSQMGTDSKPVGLKPPPSVIDLDNLPGYEDWYQASETKRFYYFTKIGKTHRGSAEKMWVDLKKKQETIQIAETISKEKLDYNECMQELEELFKGRAERLKDEK